MTQQYFKRNEKKYLLNSDQYTALQHALLARMKPDRYFESDIHSIYFDTENDDLVIASLEHPDYKYKVRVRSYGDDNIFFEIKSKLDGTVYKRRTKLTRSDYETYMKGELPVSGQVMHELDHLIQTYELTPKVFMTYARRAYRDQNEDSDLRITFDGKLRSRMHDVVIDKYDECDDYFVKPTYIMEVKTHAGMPLWLVSMLNSHKIYPSSFSKYGKIYQRMKQKELMYA